MANTSSSQPEITDLTAQTLRIYWRHAMKYWPMLLLCAAGVGTLLVCELASPFFYKRSSICWPSILFTRPSAEI